MLPNFCPNCGTKIKTDYSEYCPKCGIKIGSTSHLMPTHINKMTLKIEPENAWGMIEGFKKNENYYFTSIYTSHKGAKSMQGDFEHYPKVITLSKKPSSKYKVKSNIVYQPVVNKFKQNFKNRYVAVLDRIFPISNKPSIWEKLCNNGIFDIWDPTAPENSLRDKDSRIEKENPRILLLRVFEVDHDFSDEIVIANDFIDHVRQYKLNFIRPIIPQNKNDKLSSVFKGTDYFDDIIKKITESTGTVPKIVKDTSTIEFSLDPIH